MSEKSQTENLEIVDRPVDNEAEKSVRKNQDILEALLYDKVLQRNFKTSRGIFKIQYPSGKDRLKIDQYRAIRRRGLPADCFDDVANTNNNIWSTLDVAVVGGPDWYEKIRKNNPSWSWEEGPDEELVMELYNLVCTFRAEITAEIHKSKFGRTPDDGPAAGDATALGDGAFQGLTNGPPDQGAV
jgi:hypothetical protein